MNPNSPDNHSSPLQNIFAWVRNTPERAIDEAFEAAVSIKRIEEENFKGNRIANDGSFGSSVFSVFEIQLGKYLRIINLRLNFYKLSASLPYLQPQSSSNQANIAVSKRKANDQISDPVGSGQLSASQMGGNSRRFSIYQKLAFIDYTLERYGQIRDRTIDIAAQSASSGYVANRGDALTEDADLDLEIDEKFQMFKSEKNRKYKRPFQQVTPIEKSILPGSFFKAFDRVKRNLTGSYSDYEKDIVEELRQSRKRINQALRYIGLLVVAVLAVQFISKTFIFSPLINSFIDSNSMAVKFSPAVEERAFDALRLAKERIEFDYMIQKIALEQSPESFSQQDIASDKEQQKGAVNLTKSASEEVEELIQQESLKILKKFNDESLEGIKNLLADITAAFVFYIFLISGRNELLTIKEFLDEFLYSLNDNAKAFLIIISTDTFVGFHSSEGWDALLTLVFQHFGLPENKILAQTFISTVPVFLDGLFKFWIFQYLTQASPATATIYREMNE